MTRIRCNKCGSFKRSESHKCTNLKGTIRKRTKEVIEARMEIAVRVRQKCKDKGFSFHKLMYVCHVSQSNYYSFMRGHLHDDTYAKLEQTIDSI